MTGLASEDLYDGAHVAHVAAYYERLRLARIRGVALRTIAPRGRTTRISSDSVWPLRDASGQPWSARK